MISQLMKIDVRRCCWQFVVQEAAQAGFVADAATTAFSASFHTTNG